ncbi:hypothetical protein EVG20_g2199 [Dentipellis fragilis]|uniref:Uncharacterized protein n=1 Tax=Dentipellis fragilis TaxID=205917 RepID=A0A4Y9ZBP6_9AGAM|nr:hypothetical protein EVG20_g2199 [Dentipellis fragilis]
MVLDVPKWLQPGAADEEEAEKVTASTTKGTGDRGGTFQRRLCKQPNLVIRQQRCIHHRIRRSILARALHAVEPRLEENRQDEVDGRAGMFGAIDAMNVGVEKNGSGTCATSSPTPGPSCRTRALVKGAAESAEMKGGGGKSGDSHP